MKMKKRQNVREAVSAILLLAGVCHGSFSTTLGWDPSATDINGDPLAGDVTYRLFFGEIAGAENEYVDAGSSTQATIEGLEYNKTYYFRAKAYTETGESVYSDEVAWTTPAMPDTDADGLSDSWEQEFFQSLDLTHSSSDYDQDGTSDQYEFLAGTDPADPADFPALDIQAGASGAEVFFHAKQAAGSGYENRTRYYTLMQCADLVAGVWTAVDGVENIPATDQIVSCAVGADEQSVYYCTRIQLD
jgi:hypothetical protein